MKNKKKLSPFCAVRNTIFVYKMHVKCLHLPKYNDAVARMSGQHLTDFVLWSKQALVHTTQNAVHRDTERKKADRKKPIKFYK